MVKTFCIAFIFVATGGIMAARAQTDSTTAAGPIVEKNAPEAIPCSRPDCPPQTPPQRLARAQPSVSCRQPD